MNHAAQQFRDLAHSLIPAEKASEQEAANAWFRERYGNRKKKVASEAALRKHIAHLAEAIAMSPKRDELSKRSRAVLSAEQHGGENGGQGGPDLQGEDA